MKRLFSAVIAVLLVFCTVGCEGKKEKYDTLAKPFIEALLVRDEAGMSELIHPDYRDSAIPNDEFYKSLESQYFEVGHTLDGLASIAKTDADLLELEGDAEKCTYVARVNELFYTVDLIILENDNGFGVVSVAILLNTDPQYYD